ncbi:hypothetical protein PENARI_c056G00972, partial [Penicillium arizonense]
RNDRGFGMRKQPVTRS